MKLHTIETGRFKLDGGAMFGVVPKSIWESLNPADDNNMCNWALRCLLVETGNKLVLIDNGIGNKQDAKFFSYYYLHGDDSLDKSLRKLGYHADDITDVILTHLHFDHCGGSVSRVNDKLVTTFKNATYWSNEQHWQTATQPNAREKASFLKENILPVAESGQLKFALDGQEIIPGISLMMSYGHTEAMMHPVINYKDKTVVYVADMIPSSHHIPLPYVMAYDMQPLVTMNEKQKFLSTAAANQYILYFEHDPDVVCCTVKATERGVKKNEIFTLEEYFGN
jgi:glyoxylase-like metal-dependent hydrolase (beta-lactamase superfamily II)